MVKNITIITIAILILILSGIAYQYTEVKYGKGSMQKIILPVPLGNLPNQIDNWEGIDIPLTEAVKKVAGNDDFINRYYTNKLEKKWASFYVAYTGQPRNMLGHRPSICYVGAGWIYNENDTETTTFTSTNGNTYPCLIHYFSKPKPDSTTIVVLNYYILNGIPTNEESEFNSLSFRLPNIDGEIARYVAQIQISSTVKSNVLDLASITADKIIQYLPDPEGNVNIAPPDTQEVISVN